VLGKGEEEGGVELKELGPLHDELIDAAEELEENGGHDSGVCVGAVASIPVESRLASAQAKGVTKLEPLFLDESYEPGQCAVKWIQHELRQSQELRRSIPAVRAMLWRNNYSLRGGCRTEKKEKKRKEKKRKERK